MAYARSNYCISTVNKVIYMVKYSQFVVISFIVSDTNKHEISSKFPSIFIVDINNQLITYNAGFTTVPIGTVIGGSGEILASSMDEFNKLYTQIV